VRELAKLFQQCGLSVLNDTFQPIKDGIAHPWTLQHMLASAEVIQVIDRPRGSANEWWEVHDRAVAEVEHGASMRMGMVSVVGQKPHDARP